MRQERVRQVWTRIEAALAESAGPAVVATDADGTLWQGDVGEDLFRAFLDRGRVEPQSLDALRETARMHGLSDAGSGVDVARRIYSAYAEGRFPEERVCEMMAWCFAGWSRTDVRSFATEVLDRGRLAERALDETRALLEHVCAAGIEIVVVSASPHVVVSAGAARFGFSEPQVVAACPRYANEHMIAEVERPIPYASGKVLRLRERIGPTRPLVAALGDNVFDLDLLASARIAVAVRPKPRLRASAARVHGIVELAPLEPS